MARPNVPKFGNPDMFPDIAPPSKPKTQTEGMEATRQTNKHRVSREDGDFRANSPARSGGRGSNSGRPSSRQSGGSDHSIAKSPLQPYSQAKISGRVAASPVWEGKNSYDSSHGTPGRSFESARNTPGRSFESAHATPGRNHTKQESPDRGAVVPKFGGWDDKDPQAAENYTEVFNMVLKERHVNSGNMPGSVGRPSYSTQRNQRNEKQKSCCFHLW